jgi:uncharacterized protein (TIGR03437 family)
MKSHLHNDPGQLRFTRIPMSNKDMRDRIRTALPLAFGTALSAVLLAASTVLSWGAAPTSQAIWVNSVSGLPSPVTDAPAMNTLIQNSAASNVNMLYVSVYSSTPDSQGRYLVDESAISGLIQAAHSHGIQVYNAMGDSDWPTKGCASSQTPYARFADTLGYDSANPAARFDGIMLDVEPGSNPDFPSLLELYQCFQQQASASGLGLAAAINAYWTTSVTFNGVTEVAYQQIVDLKLTSLVVMGYLNSTGTLDCSQSGIACLDAPIIEYANATGQAGQIVVGVDTDNPATSGSAANDTFYALGQAAMNAAVQSVYSQVAAANLAFGGFSINNYRDSYLSGTVTGWPSTNPGLLGLPPQFTAASVVNAAGMSGGSIAPGEVTSIFGQNLGPASPLGPQVVNGALTTNLGGVEVLFNGIPAPMILAYSTQLNCVAPFEIQGSSSVSIEVQYAGLSSAPVSVAVATAAPGIFTANSSGQGPAAALNQDYSYNTSAHPAAAGSAVMLYVTGTGAITPNTADGSVNLGAENLPTTQLPVTAQIGGLAAQVMYAGNSSGIVSGVTQVNVLVPAGVQAGAQPVTLRVGGYSSQTGVTISVQ